MVMLDNMDGSARGAVSPSTSAPSPSSSSSSSCSSLSSRSTPPSLYTPSSQGSVTSPTCTSTTTIRVGARKKEWRREKPTRACGVCGDVAKSFHFGGLACDSCKAFFRRSVQNDVYKGFTCAHGRQCKITLSSRKCCQFCRFEKCLGIGMERGWVMSEDERKELMKQRMDKKYQQRGRPQEVDSATTDPGPQPQQSTSLEMKSYEPRMEDLEKWLSKDGIHTIEELVKNYEKAFHEVPYEQGLSHFNEQRPSSQIIQMFSTAIRRFHRYAEMIAEFARISHHDQVILLKDGILEMCLLRGALVFDSDNARWPNCNLSLYKNCPQLKVDDMQRLVSPHLYQLHMKFIRGVQDLSPDDPSIMIMIMVVLFSPDRPRLEDPHQIGVVQEKFLILLRKYMGWRYGARNARITYPKLLTKLVDLRTLNDSRNEAHLRLSARDVEEIRNQLGSIVLAPYDTWDQGTAMISTKIWETLEQGSAIPKRRHASDLSIEARKHEPETPDDCSESMSLPEFPLHQPNLSSFPSFDTFFAKGGLGPLEENPAENILNEIPSPKVKHEEDSLEEVRDCITPPPTPNNISCGLSGLDNLTYSYSCESYGTQPGDLILPGLGYDTGKAGSSLSKAAEVEQLKTVLEYLTRSEEGAASGESAMKGEDDYARKPMMMGESGIGLPGTGLPHHYMMSGNDRGQFDDIMTGFHQAEQSLYNPVTVSSYMSHHIMKQLEASNGNTPPAANPSIETSLPSHNFNDPFNF